jgi:predicted PurR-regulated permease PerM
MNQTPDSPSPKREARDIVPPLFQNGGLTREMIRVLIVGFALFFGWRIAHHLVAVFLMFALVFLLAIVLNSVVVVLEKRGVRRGLAVGMIMLSFIGAILLGGWLIVPPALQQANALVVKAPKYWQTIQSRAAELEKQYPALHNLWPQVTGENQNAAADRVEDAVNANAATSPAEEAPLPPESGAAPATSNNKDKETAVKKSPLENFLQQDAVLGYLKSALAFTTGLAGAVFVMVLSFLLLMFTLANPQGLVGGLLSVVPDSHHEAARRSLARIFMQMAGWARATVINGSITGILTGVGLALVGVKPALVLGICAFFGEFVPNVGPLIAAIPALFVAAADSPATALKALGVIVFVQAVASNAINPLIMGREMKLHPVTITFFALSMGKLFGVAGAIMAVPAAATAKILVEEFYLRPRGVQESQITAEADAIVKGEAGVDEPDAEKVDG